MLAKVFVHAARRRDGRQELGGTRCCGETDRGHLVQITIGGIIMLADTKAEEAEELVEPVSAGGPTSENDEGDEPEPPEPFEYQDE
ncbi:unnamed protein product [Ixodes pacificus]